MDLFNLERLVVIVPAFVIAIAVHEFSHALAATLLGDATPRGAGRLTLNPLRHLDPLGTILLFIYGFGWGRPVYVNPSGFRVNPFTGMALVAFAGPLSNVILATLFGAAFKFNLDVPNSVASFLFAMAYINVILAVFNLIPLPPLDGFSVLMGILPRRLAVEIAPVARYGPAALLALFFLPSVLKIDLIGPIMGPPMRILLRFVAGA